MLKRLGRHLIRTYLSIDPRVLGIFRIFFGILILVDLFERVPGIRTWYSNEGVLPNYVLLQRPMIERNFSFFLAASTPQEAALGFAVCGIVFFCFLIGWKTRLFHLLSLVCMLSLHGRNNYIENASDIVRHILCLWTLFLSLGRCYSVDSLSRSSRSAARDERRRPVVSLATFALLLQLAVIYFFNAVQKDGITWKQGTVVHYLLHMDFQVTDFGILVRDRFPLWISKALTWGTLAIEGSAPFFILSPMFPRYCRRIVIFLLACLHLGMMVFMNLGLFSQTMLVYLILLLPSEDLDSLGRALSRIPSAAIHSLPRFMDRWVGLLKPVLGSTQTQFAKKKEPVLAGKIAAVLREGAVLVFFLSLGSSVLATNAVPAVLQIKQPRLFEAIAGYVKAHQAWRLFAPDPPVRDGTVVVDATTVDGRHVDPYNAEASNEPEPILFKVPGHRCKDRFWSYYTFWLRYDADASNYYPALRDWILRYPERTSNPRDAIASFNAYWVETFSPRPGEGKATLAKKDLIFSYP